MSDPQRIIQREGDDKGNESQTTQHEPGSHPFEVDDSDHCETPFKAYQDLTVILDRLLDDDESTDGNNTSKNRNSNRNRKPRSSLRIYDPYYCDGGVKTKLASMGFTNVINENRDFYKDIETGQVPDYDVLVTNPPYSGHHMEKLLEFCASQQAAASSSKKKKPHRRPRPSFLLLPHFVYTKDYYTRALPPPPSSNNNRSFFSFLVPKIRYSYVPPTWVADRSGASRALSKGKETTAPFPSFWYCCHLTTNTVNNNNNNNNVNVNITHNWLETTFGVSGSISSQHLASGLRYASTPLEIPRDFKGEFDPTNKRPNPRARKRMRKAGSAVNNGGAPAPAQPQKQQQRQRQRERDPKKKKRY
jgi:hypothetical protein